MVASRKDHLGSTRAVVNASGTVVEAHDYYPFGLLMPGRDSQSGSETKEKFTGKERDTETGLAYFGARYYWAGGGRWWSVDPLMNIYPSLSSYTYVANNPLIIIDPAGETWYIISETYEEIEEYTDENGEIKTRTVTKTRYRLEWVDDGKNAVVTTTSDIVNAYTNNGEIDWSAVSNASGSNVYEINGYVVIANVLQGGIGFIGMELGNLFYLDVNGYVYMYDYRMVGGGFSPETPGVTVGIMAGFEIGFINTKKDPKELGGWFWGVSGFAAARWGVSFSFTSTGLFTDPAVTIGGGAGVGAGLTFQTGYAKYIGSKHIKDLIRIK